ncbi:MAG: hypothetical protein IT233_02055 [Bacteroidia bacterium]|nr:hypothetical protein [Bacteroidia bacterium]
MFAKKKISVYKRDTSTLFDHALEPAGSVRGIDFINDSRSIRVNTTWESLRSMETGSKNVLLILGGQDRGVDYSLLRDLMKEKVKGLICLSSDPDRMYRMFRRECMFFAHAISIEEAVFISSKWGRSGDLVLFSPSCPSYDAFDNYKNRGDLFKKAVRKLLP